MSEGDKESQWTTFSTIDSCSDEEESSTRRIPHQVAEEVLRTRRSVTPGAGDLEEEISHGSTVASPPNVAATTIVPLSALQTVGAQASSRGSLGVQFEEEIMSYPYPKYSNHPNARWHFKQFHSIWAMNHKIQGLSTTNAEQSKIVEFQLSLEGQAA